LFRGACAFPLAGASSGACVKVVQVGGRRVLEWMPRQEAGLSRGRGKDDGSVRNQSRPLPIFFFFFFLRRVAGRTPPPPAPPSPPRPLHAPTRPPAISHTPLRLEHRTAVLKHKVKMPETTAADEDAIIRHRLMTSVSGVRGEPPLKKLAKA